MLPSFRVLSARSSRIPSLDGLRALSISLVFVGHFAYSAGSPLHHNWWTDLYAHFGVRIFFVISGFLITGLLIREKERTGTINLRQFYIRRAYRIIPAAYAYLFVITFCFHDSIAHNYLIAAYFYLTSPFALHSPWILSHLWSLSVEEQFYLVWPVVVMFSFMFARRFAFLAIALAPLFRLALHGHWSQGEEWAFPSVADSLASGCLLALLQPKLKKCSFFTWRGFPMIWVLAFSIPALFHNRFGASHEGLASTIGWTFANLGIVLCVQNAMAVRTRILNLPGVVWVGTLSYSLYLWQMPFANPRMQSWVTSFPQNVVFACLAGVISFYAIEQPFLRLREQLADRSDRLRIVFPHGMPLGH